MSEWTDEMRQEVIDKYQAAEPTAETSVEIVSDLAEEYDKTPNGVRMILSKAGVYVKKDPASAGSSKAKASSGGGTRVSKADAIASLASAIEATGQEPNDEILSKLTGKAAVYFKEVIENCNNEAE